MSMKNKQWEQTNDTQDGQGRQMRREGVESWDGPSAREVPTATVHQAKNSVTAYEQVDDAFIASGQLFLLWQVLLISQICRWEFTL